jgi:AcrR family transcriptional regulator
MAKTGRRRGNPDTREEILQAAREAFGQHGFDGASIRSIAAAADVDPALVHHYFGTKDQLFAACIQAPVDAAEVVRRVIEGGPERVGERLVASFLAVWDDPVTGPAAVALFRTALRHDWSARMLREFLTTQILRRVIAGLDLPADQAPLRTVLVAAQMLGLAGIRYVLKVPPLDTAPVDVIVATVGPTIQSYLTGELPAAAARGWPGADRSTGARQPAAANPA